MAKLVSKVYGDALFEAALEDNRLSGLSDEVTAVKEIIAANDDLSKLMDQLIDTTMLSLSIGTTTLASPSCSAL